MAQAHACPRQQFGRRLAVSAAEKLKADGLLPVIVPVECQVEAPEGCGFHVLRLDTCGVDLDAVSTLQMLEEPSCCSASGIAGLPLALHLCDKPHIRIVIGYTCKPSDLLVPLSRYVLRSPNSVLVVLAPPRAHTDGKSAEMLMLSVDIDDFLTEAPPMGSETDASQIESEIVDVTEENIGKRLQIALERLWYEEISRRQLEPDVGRSGPGKLTQSARFLHYVTASGRVVCSGLSVSKASLLEIGAGITRGDLLPIASSWEQLEGQLSGVISRICGRSEPSSKSSRKKQKKSAKGTNSTSTKHRPEPSQTKADRRRLRQEEFAKNDGQVGAIRQEDEDIAPDAPEIKNEEGVDSSDQSGQGSLQMSCSFSCSWRSGASVHFPDDCDGSACSDVAAPGGSSAASLNDSDRERNSDDDRSTPKACKPRNHGIRQEEVPDRPMAHVEERTVRAPEDDSTSRASSGNSSSRRESSSIGNAQPKTKLVKYTRSWADLSENQDDDEVETEQKTFVLEAEYLRDQVGKHLENEYERDEDRWTESWRGVGAALDELPHKVMDALTGAIAEATGDVLNIPEQKRDVPAAHRSWSTPSPSDNDVDDSHGLLSGAKPWISPVSELGEWYELRREIPGLICGVVMSGDKGNRAWVEVVKFKTLREDDIWSDVDGGLLFQACRNADDPVKVTFEAVHARAVRIYPVVWHDCIALHAALLYPKQEGINIGEAASMTLREDATRALAGMMSDELDVLSRAGQIAGQPGRGSAQISELVTMLYSIPSKVADAATRLESMVVKAWKEKARADEALQEARQWVESIPEDQPLALAARAQEAAMDQVSEALMVLEELHLGTASSVAHSLLEAKTDVKRRPSEKLRLHAGLQGRPFPEQVPAPLPYKKHVRPSSASSCTLETVLESFEAADDGTQAASKKLEFWLELFLTRHAFRVSGPNDSSIWYAEEMKSSMDDPDKTRGKNHHVFSYRMAPEVGTSVLQAGEGVVGEIIKTESSSAEDEWTPVESAFVSVVLAGVRASSRLAPLRQLSRDGMCRNTVDEVSQVVISLVDDPECRALSVSERGIVQLSTGFQGWESEKALRHWSVSERGQGFRLKWQGGGGELAVSGHDISVAETGSDWKLQNIEGWPIAVHIVVGSGAIAVNKGGYVEFTTERSRFSCWQVYQQSHSSEQQERAAMHQYELEPGDGVFKGARAWKRDKELRDQPVRTLPTLTE